MNAKIETAEQALESVKEIENRFGGTFVEVEAVRQGRIVMARGIHNFKRDAAGCEAIRQAARELGFNSVQPNMISWHAAY